MFKTSGSLLPRMVTFFFGPVILLAFFIASCISIATEPTESYVKATEIAAVIDAQVEKVDCGKEYYDPLVPAVGKYCLMPSAVFTRSSPEWQGDPIETVPLHSVYFFTEKWSNDVTYLVAEAQPGEARIPFHERMVKHIDWMYWPNSAIGTIMITEAQYQSLLAAGVEVLP